MSRIRAAHHIVVLAVDGHEADILYQGCIVMEEPCTCSCNEIRIYAHRPSCRFLQVLFSHPWLCHITGYRKRVSVDSILPHLITHADGDASTMFTTKEA